MLKIYQDNWPKLFAALAEVGELYLPSTNKDGKTDFVKWQEGVKADLEATQTSRSIKDIFFPQVENLLDFQASGKKLSLTERPYPEQPTVVFGVRACDIRSFTILDRVFLNEPVDGFYKARRENCTLIGTACSAPDETCFCTAFGIDPTQPESDVQTWFGKDGYLYWEPVTEKGRLLTAKVAECLLVANGEKDKALVEEQQAATRTIMSKLPLASFKVADKIPANEEKVFNSKIWTDLSSTCLSCCTCTYVCPTCHCYDVRDFSGAEGKVVRYRCWDSCMASDFTKMAAVNPRHTKLERFRQRYMHKLVYFPENNDGVFACVGCGRCLQKCPVNLNIVKVAKALEVAPDV